MKIVLSDLGKRYNTEWIFRHLNYTFDSQHAYVILGSNGSGKSTLLQVISGIAPASEGTLAYSQSNQSITQEHVFRKVAVATPYLELFEDFNLMETLAFHGQFKTFIPQKSHHDLAGLMQLEHAKNKPLKYYSSGMKQRVKLGLAIFSDTPILLLDEPTSNLDENGIAWYQEIIDQMKKDRLIIVCSNNQKAEYLFCDQELRVEDFKTRK